MGKKHWLEFFVAALAALSAMATIVGLLFQIQVTEGWLPWIILAGIIIVCLFYAYWMTRVKKRISLKLSERWIVDIKEDDIFSCDGIVAIPVNEYFDTKADDIIIARKSIHGQFLLRYFANNPDELSEKIESSLKGITPVEIVERGDGLPKKKYEMGTCADVVVGDKLFVLFVFTHFDRNNHCYLAFEDYPLVTAKLISHLETIANMRRVSIPLFGTGQSGLNKSPQRILSYLIDSLDFLSPKSFPAGFSIILRGIKENKIKLNSIN